MGKLDKLSLEKLAEDSQLLHKLSLDELRKVHDVCKLFYESDDKFKKFAPNRYKREEKVKKMRKGVEFVEKEVVNLIGKKNLKLQQEEK